MPKLGDGAAQAGIVAEDAEMALVERLQDGTAEGVLKVVCKDACFGGGFFRRPFGRYGLERLSVRDGLGGKSGGNDTFEQGVAGKAVGSVQAGAGGFA